jgi:Uma2 family endonuclease
MSAALKPPPARMTVAEFLEWDSGDPSGRRWQLVDGEPVAMAPASDNHGSIQSELARLLGNHLLERAGPCRIVTEPGIVPRVRAAENWRIPDLGVTCAPSTGSVDVPDPVLLVEILSPNNHGQTRANVWTYTTLPSVREVLVVHSTRIEAELLRRLPDGSWPGQPLVVREDETLTLDSVGLTLSVRAMYRTTSLAA